jgi:hypothetical protein
MSDRGPLIRCGVARPSVTIAVESWTRIERWYACAARKRSRSGSLT